MFRDRVDAAQRLAECFRGRRLHHPLVLAIPRGGVVTGAVLAQELNADLDVVLSRKLRAPDQPELALGAITEDGRIYLDAYGQEIARSAPEHLEQEQDRQLAEIARRKQLVRAIKPQAPAAGRSVIVVDDGIATGSTMIAALQTVRAQNPLELIAAAPVGAPERLREVGQWCDEVVCLISTPSFRAIGEFYADFRAVEDAEVLALLREAKRQPPRSPEVDSASSG